MNTGDLEGSVRWLYEGDIPAFARRISEKPRKASVRVVSP